MSAPSDLTELGGDVERLASLDRRSATAGERGAAAWIERRLRQAGAADVRVEPFRYQGTFAAAHAAHLVAGIVAARRGGLAEAALAVAALASYEREFAGRSQWVRRLLPAGEGANVVARVPARGARRRTVVLVAHHDAARTGLMWHPRVTAIAGRRAASCGKVDSFATVPEAALALVAVGSLLRRRALRAAGAAVLAAIVALLADAARGPTVPGASDNATGVAALVALVSRFAARPLPGTELLVLSTGCEEAGMGGMRAWLDTHGRRLDPAATLVLGVDTLGAGEPVVVAGEGPVRTERYRPEDVALAQRGARRAGIDGLRPFRIGGWTDPVLARQAGFRAVSLVSVSERGFPNYHRPSDVPERVDWRSVERCVGLAAAIAELWAEEDG